MGTVRRENQEITGRPVINIRKGGCDKRDKINNSKPVVLRVGCKEGSRRGNETVAVTGSERVKGVRKEGAARGGLWGEATC